MINNFDDKEFQKDQGNYFEPFDKDKDFFKQWIDPYTTNEQRIRDQEITSLLQEYVNYYRFKTASNGWIKKILFIICIFILCLFALSLLTLIWKYSCSKQASSTEDVVQLITVSITFITLVFEILKIITQYIFPSNDEEYITRIVELIQNNDLENKRENIKIGGTSSDVS